jgi:diguanylate cyclase (GGDEF)-like protein
VSVAHVPLGDKGLLVLVERRAERVLEPEDWVRLDALARHATAALDRVQLREQTQALSLTDPVTGLGNRRKLEVLLPYHLAAAQRGAPLALAVFELVEDREEMRDASLHLLGECLRRQARGSDILARYGPTSFVALLPNTTADGAWSLVRRVRSALGQAAAARAGVAAYASTASTLGQLLEQASASVES